LNACKEKENVSESSFSEIQNKSILPKLGFGRYFIVKQIQIL